MFKKILIANRGEIACRVAATARRMGDPHRGRLFRRRRRMPSTCAPATRRCTSAAARRKDSYLRWERILEAAKATGAQAIHPGYGFLSENEDFAQACADAGLVFIGPPPSAIQAMGLKAESKQLMEKAGVPLVPGYHGADQDPALLQREADRIGYPVLIKASAGGGGKGMRAVEQARGLRRRAGLVPARGDQQLRRRRGADREVRAAAAPHRDPGVRRHARQLRLPVRARLLGAAAPPEGAGRSARARHDRGDAPARWARRRWPRRGRSATSAPARSSSSSSSATAAAMDFFFMEMNTRLQVEHPVTEAITGLDLVEWQLRVAAGEPLPLTQDAAADPRPCDRGAHLRREPRQQLPARHRHAARLPQARRPPPSQRSARCASTTACARATRSRPSTTR